MVRLGGRKLGGHRRRGEIEKGGGGSSSGGRSCRRRRPLAGPTVDQMTILVLGRAARGAVLLVVVKGCHRLAVRRLPKERD